jgi:hypothetical protein
MDFRKAMYCRVKPGNDGCGAAQMAVYAFGEFALRTLLTITVQTRRRAR